MLKYLDNKEKKDTKKIWGKIFKEDTNSFLDYYYSYKNKDNKILCKFVNDNIVSMLHLNPYKMFINGYMYNSYYIVAVATLKEHRKKGYMAELLNKSLNDMYKDKIPFTFLRPAKEEIYLPFDFTYIYNHNFLTINNNFKEIEIIEKDYEKIANFTNNFLKEKYNVFCIRSLDYIKILHQEVKSENGNIVMLFDNDNFIGYYVYWGFNEKIIRGVFLEDKYTVIKETKPLVMARIINLYELFKNILSKEDISICLNIKDNIIKENNGIFKINITKETSSIEKLISPLDNTLSLNINDLTSILFGYKNINQFTKNKCILDKFSKIHLLNRVFIDEEV